MRIAARRLRLSLISVFAVSLTTLGSFTATTQGASKEKLTPEMHVQAVLEDKDAHSLWLLLARGAIARLTVDSQTMDVNIDSARRMIERWSKTDDYQTTARHNLEHLGIPRDWNAENAKRIAYFRSQHPDAIILETKHYHVLSTSSKKTTKKLAKKMDAVFELYEKLFDFKEKIPYKCVIKFWKDERQYLANGAPEGSAAYYAPSTKELVGYNTRAMSDTRHMDPLHSMYHEGWHQFFDFYIPGAPRWFDEGFAEFFEKTQVGRNRASMRRNNYQAKRAAFHLKNNRLVPLRELFRMDHAQFMVDPDLTYAQSYSFISFLMNFKHGDKRLQRSVHSFYRDYFWLLRDGVDPVEAADQIFGNIKLEVLEEMWKKSVRRQR